MSLKSALDIKGPLKVSPLFCEYAPAAKSIPLCPLFSFAKLAFKVSKLGFNALCYVLISTSLSLLSISALGSEALISFSISPFNINVSIASLV